MLREALRFPLRGDRGDALETLAVGGGLHLLAAFVPVLPLVPVVGYLVGVLRDESAAPDERRDGGDPALFRHPRRLLRDGLVGSAVCLAYLLPAAAFLLLTVGRAVTDGVPADVPAPVFVVAGTLSLLLAISFAYVLPAALVGLARSGWRGAFAPGPLFGVVTTGRYFFGWTVGAVALGVALALAPGLNRLALGFFLLFYAEVVAVSAWGAAVRGNRFRAGR